MCTYTKLRPHEKNKLPVTLQAIPYLCRTWLALLVHLTTMKLISVKQSQGKKTNALAYLHIVGVVHISDRVCTAQV